MDISTSQFLAFTLAAFVVGIAAGIGAVVLWILRAMATHDASEGDL
jgi:hypothetical protein